MDEETRPEDFVTIAATNQALYALDRVGRVWVYHPASQKYHATWTILTNHRGGAKWRDAHRPQGTPQPQETRQ